MILNSVEAFSKWCPFSRSVIDYGDEQPLAASVNRDAFGAEGWTAEGCMCLGNNCTAWRYLSGQSAVDLDDRRGYCGLAGKPEDA